MKHHSRPRALAKSRLQAKYVMALLLMSTTGCDVSIDDGGGADPPWPPQTEFLDVRLDPDTVAALDTVLIHAVIRDSTDMRFVFMWVIGENVLPVNGSLTGPLIKLIAPRTSQIVGQIGSLSGGVVADNGSQDSSVVQHRFEIPIRN